MIEEINIRSIKNGILITQGGKQPYYVKDRVEVIGVISALMLENVVSGDDLDERFTTPADSG